MTCHADQEAELHDDHLLVRNGDGILFKVQFLETRPLRRLEARALL